MYDLVIIGHAAAGPAAAIYAARRNLNLVILTKDVGGEVALSGEVENWPSVIHTTGIELANAFHEHTKSYNVPIEQGLEVTGIQQEKNHHIVIAKDFAGNEKKYETKSVVIATGIHPRKLGVPGEDKLKGRGVTSCTVCDGPLFKNKITATVGAGNSALESVLMMGGIAQKVYLLTKYDQSDLNGGFPRGENILIDKAKKLQNLEIIYNADTIEILGDNAVSGLKYRDLKTGEEKHIEVSAAMIHIGMIPNSDFATRLTKNNNKEIEIDMLCRTNVPGIFAAGDVTNIPYKQISISVGMGATAALSAIDYLNHWQE
ncbi:MAG: hypothetical protein A3J66_04300 [Candidatus Magasanikbacteria bacterium RIFCSPHIGHO2_02_FULL_47_14]|uniref:FAD/NAD(P)-binding domain-containing protein n=1 Tax=Candidatus Magasanikbacteria bacterium RIFCSPHIGHO2_02_FULL_47_14 TaxID=1798680 RepID=A0A1F6M4B7_9BACT|nr:MAG: hypothetical protein A3J66_04300 [Candidatus Magasanikbacteria bacterium RIFCSPHIGHO2_02_FULL_47_14]